MKNDFRAEGLSEAISLPHKGRGKVCVHSTVPRPHGTIPSIHVLVYLGTSY